MSQYSIYVHRDNGRQAIITEDNSNSKFKTMRLMFLDDKTEKEFSTSTVKRWWKKTEETFEYEETAGDGTTYKEVMQDILQDEKKAAAKKEASKYVDAGKKITEELNKNNSQSLQEMVDAQAEKPKKASKVKQEKKPVFDSTALQEFAIKTVQELGGDFVQRHQNNGAKDMAQKVFRAGGKMFMHMSYPRYELRMDTRGVDVEELVPTSALTGFYSARYIFTEDTKEVRSKIKKILTQAYKAQLAKNTSKKGKGEK